MLLLIVWFYMPAFDDFEPHFLYAAGKASIAVPMPHLRFSRMPGGGFSAEPWRRILDASMPAKAMPRRNRNHSTTSLNNHRRPV